jgi:hypothetical protein
VKKIYPILLIFVLIVFTSPFLKAQIGGRYAFSFLEQPVSARVAALGSNTVAINDDDINMGYVNPSLISEKMNNIISLAYVDYFSDINYGFAQYGHSFKEIGSFVATLQFNNYGKFDYADETGNVSGSFSASDAVLNIGWGRSLGKHFRIGSSLNLIYSGYESYSSFGFAFDVAGSYFSESGWEMSLVASSIGAQLSTYSPGGERDPLPFNLQYALSKRLEHVPFRFSFVFDHIEKWDLMYEDPNNPSDGIDPITGLPQYKTGFSKFADNLMRHVVLGGEVYIGKNVIVRGGYNYRRRQELKLNGKPGMAGFSWGFGVRIYKFKFNYARTTYNKNGSPNYISMTFDLESLLKK